MNKRTEKLLKKYGWQVDCELPFEISNKNTGFASGFAASMIVEYLELTEKYDDLLVENRQLRKQLRDVHY